MVSAILTFEIGRTFCENKLKKTKLTDFRTKKMRKKSEKFYFQSKGYGNLFSSWIVKKKMVLKMSRYSPKAYVKVESGLSSIQQMLIQRSNSP